VYNKLIIVLLIHLVMQI